MSLYCAQGLFLRLFYQASLDVAMTLTASLVRSIHTASSVFFTFQRWANLKEISQVAPLFTHKGFCSHSDLSFQSILLFVTTLSFKYFGGHLYQYCCCHQQKFSNESSYMYVCIFFRGKKSCMYSTNKQHNLENFSI